MFAADGVLDLLQIVVLALIQGVTEFLPISSSAHLLLPQALSDWPDQGLDFDVAVHLGSLAAVMLYFRAQLVALVRAWFASLAGHHSADSRLAWYLGIATIPAGLAALIFGDWIEQYLRGPAVIMMTTVVFALYLAWSDRYGSQTRGLAALTLGSAVLIGLAQALALVPGTSRSGITISAALALGLQRESAARFSFLMSIPVILLSGVYQGAGLVEAPRVDWRELLLGTAIAGVSAYICIHLFLGAIQRIGMLPFVIYRLLLGGCLAVLLWTGFV